MSATALDYPPLSFAQERLWLLARLHPDATVYAVRRAYRLRGVLDVAALVRSIARIVRRHGALRTTFPIVEGRPVQAVAPSLILRLPAVDLSQLPPGRREAELQRVAREQVARPFDLALEPLLRSALVRLGSEEHVLLLAVHHIVFDGWSLAIFRRELTMLYEAFGGGRPSPLPERAGSYLDFARWQRRRMRGDRLRRELEHWREHMAGAAPVLELPFDGRRLARPTFRGGVRTLRLPRELSEDLEQTGRREGATLFMTLLAAFQAVLARQALASDVCVGSPVAGRTRTEHEGLIGLFTNVLVLRTSWAGDPGFSELLGLVRRTCLDAFDHQELPFEALVEDLNPARELSRNPLFQVMFSFHSDPALPERLGDLAIESVELERTTARFDLTLDVFRRRDGITLALEYSTDLLEGVTVDRLLRHLRRTLEQVASDPRRRLSGLPAVDDAERRELTVDRNPPGRSSAGSPLLARFERWARRSPEAPALVRGEGSLGYGELDRRANRLAHFLREKGVGPEVRVAVLLDRSEMVISLLAVLKAGGAFVPLDPSHPAERLTHQLRDCGARVLLVDGGGSAVRLRPEVEVVDLRRQAEPIRARSERTPPAAGTPNQLAYVIYTSGSTGRPKGVMVTRRNLASFFTALDRALGGGPDDVWLAVTPLGFDISVLELLWTLTRGSKVVLHPGIRHGPGTLSRRRGSDRVDLSLFFFASPEECGPTHDRYRLLVESARLADRLGFVAVWTPERHFHPFGGIFPNPSVTGAALSAVTERLRIRAGSVVLPLHDPIRVAEEWSVVDNLSGGRVDVSLASGWHPKDFVLAPHHYDDRKELLVSAIATLRRLWRGEDVEVTGEDGDRQRVRTFPRPIQNELPLWMTTAGNPETFRLAGEQGCNLLTHLLGQGVDALAEKIAIYRQARRRSPFHGAGHVTLMLHTFVAGSSREARQRAREPLRRYLENSFDLLALAADQRPDLDLGGLTEAERNTLMQAAVDRYVEGSGLIGSPAECETLLERLRAIGVQEIACLIDFGLDFDTVMAGLEELAALGGPAAARAPAHEPGIEAWVERHGVTNLQCTPSLLAMIEAQDASLSALAGLRRLLVGGEVFPAELAERARREISGRLYNLYGPTETTVWSTLHEVGRAGRSVPIGRPLANSRIYLLDELLEPVPEGIPGELCIGGASVARGYLGRPALTAKRFLPDTFDAGPGARLYRTGDLARYRPGGDLEFLARVDDQVKIAGHRIEPGEIEAALNRHPSVRESAVVSGSGEAGLVAWIVPMAPVRRRVGWRSDAPAGVPAVVEVGGGVYRLPNGLRILCASRRQAAAGYRELMEEEVYFRHGVDVSDGDVVVDVGANVGLFSLSVHERCPSATIYAFEPVPPTFEMLRRNLESHGVAAQCFPWGFAERAAERELTHFPRMPGLSGLPVADHRPRELAEAMLRAQLDGPEAETAEVYADLDRMLDERYRSESHLCRLVTLSQVIRWQGIERIDLLKVDVEGAEPLVLRGIGEEDWDRIGQLAIEVHSAETVSRICDELRGRGFETSREDQALAAAGNGGSAAAVHYVYARNPSLPSGRRPARARTARGREELSERSLRSLLRRRLPEPMIPAEFRTIDRLPLTRNGKLDRDRLRRASGSRLPSASAAEPPRNRLEEKIQGVWREVLPGRRIGVTDSFFDLGGNSLLLVQTMVKLRRVLGRHVPITDLFDHPTVRSLAGHLAGALPAGGAASAGRQRGELRRHLGRPRVPGPRAASATGEAEGGRPR